MLQAQRYRVLLPTRLLNYFNSSCTIVLRLTSPPTEINTRNIPGGKARPAHTDNLNAVCLKKCGILNISQSYRPPRSVTGDSFALWRRSVLPVRYELDCKYCYK
jgi:hypothetical protein